MSKKDYSSLSADEVTRQYGDLLEKQMNIQRDKSTGTLRTLFNLAALRLPMAADWRNLHAAMLEKNGIEKIEANVCYNYLPEVIAAVEARGSTAAEKLKRFDQFERETASLAKKMERPPAHGFLSGVRDSYAHVAANIQAAKLLP